MADDSEPVFDLTRNQAIKAHLKRVQSEKLKFFFIEEVEETSILVNGVLITQTIKIKRFKPGYALNAHSNANAHCRNTSFNS